MSKKPVDTRRINRPLNVRISPETRRLFEQILERDGVPYNAQVERAMKMWAASKGIGAPGEAGRDA